MPRVARGGGSPLLTGLGEGVERQIRAARERESQQEAAAADDSATERASSQGSNNVNVGDGAADACEAEPAPIVGEAVDNAGGGGGEEVVVLPATAVAVENQEDPPTCRPKKKIILLMKQRRHRKVLRDNIQLRQTAASNSPPHTSLLCDASWCRHY